MGKIYIGCAGFVGSRPSYWKELNLVELTDTFIGFPGSRALKAIRPEAGPGVRIIVTANQTVTHPAEDKAFQVRREGHPAGLCGHFRATEAVQDGWAATLQAADQVQAEGILLRTPTSFTPSALHRADLSRFVEQVRPALGPRRLIWEPTGLWEAADAEDLCAALGLFQAVNPLRDAPTPGPFGYFRLRGLIGLRRQYTDDDMTDLLDLAADFDEAFIVFDHQDRLADARRATRIALAG